MTFWKRPRPDASGPPPSGGGTPERISTNSFQQILSAARALGEHHGITCNDDLFDTNLGFGLAQRYDEARQPSIMMAITTAILLSHCGREAAVAFVRHLLSKGHNFGVSLTPDFRIIADAKTAVLAGMTDIYGLARDRAAIGDIKQEYGPFRGPAGLLWDYGYYGLRSDIPQIKEARAALAHKALHTWEIEAGSA